MMDLSNIDPFENNPAGNEPQEFDWMNQSSPAGTQGDVSGFTGGYDPGSTMDLFKFNFPDVNISSGGETNLGDFDMGLVDKFLDPTGVKNTTMAAAERAGLGGMRWSSVLGNKAAQASAAARQGVTMDLLGKWLQLQEAARQRAASASMAAASNAMEQYLLPMRLASAYAGLGGQVQGLEQEAWNPAYQNWMRETPEGAWGTYAPDLEAMTGGYPQGTPMYSEGWASGLMGLGGALNQNLPTSPVYNTYASRGGFVGPQPNPYWGDFRMPEAPDVTPPGMNSYWGDYTRPRLPGE